MGDEQTNHPDMMTTLTWVFNECTQQKTDAVMASALQGKNNAVYTETLTKFCL